MHVESSVNSLEGWIRSDSRCSVSGVACWEEWVVPTTEMSLGSQVGTKPEGSGVPE